MFENINVKLSMNALCSQHFTIYKISLHGKDSGVFAFLEKCGLLRDSKVLKMLGVGAGSILFLKN